MELVRDEERRVAELKRVLAELLVDLASEGPGASILLKSTSIQSVR